MKKLLFLLLTAFALPVSGQIMERLPCIDKKFSIVVHIVMDNAPAPNITENQILQGVDSLNVKFAPICVSFEVCEFRYISNTYYDTVKNKNWKEMQNLYNVGNRINLYYVNEILDPPGGACGFAGLGCITNVKTEGIVIKKVPCAGTVSKTLMHEMGHYFGLPHTFEGSGIELVNGSNCSTMGDKICDTPSDPFIEGDSPSSYVNGNCRFISMKKDANNRFYDPMVENIMSYYGGCRCRFTHEQYMKMAKTYLAKTGMW